MLLSSNPKFEEVTSLLLTCGLPSEDITPQMLQEFVVIREDDSLLGVAGLQIFGSVALVRSVGVDAAHRSRSLGSSLLAAIEARARQRSVKQLYLLTKDAQLFFTSMVTQSCRAVRLQRRFKVRVNSVHRAAPAQY